MPLVFCNLCGGVGGVKIEGGVFIGRDFLFFLLVEETLLFQLFFHFDFAVVRFDVVGLLWTRGVPVSAIFFLKLLALFEVEEYFR